MNAFASQSSSEFIPHQWYKTLVGFQALKCIKNNAPKRLQFWLKSAQIWANDEPMTFSVLYASIQELGFSSIYHKLCKYWRGVAVSRLHGRQINSVSHKWKWYWIAKCPQSCPHTSLAEFCLLDTVEHCIYVKYYHQNTSISCTSIWLNRWRLMTRIKRFKKHDYLPQIFDIGATQKEQLTT